MSYEHLHPARMRKVTLNTIQYHNTIFNTTEHRPDDDAHELPPHVAHTTAFAEGKAVLASSPWAQTAPHEGPVYKSAPCIFIIDDSPTICIIVETVLQAAGYRVQSFQNGLDALKSLEQPGTQPPDLLLVDIHLPRIDGFEVIRRFKAQPTCTHCTCIILSRHDGLINQLKGNLAGAQAYITKPFTTQTLLKTIRTYLTNDPIKPA